MVAEGGDVIQGYAGKGATNTTILNFATGLLVNGAANLTDGITSAATLGADAVVLFASDALVLGSDMTLATGALAAFNLAYTTQTSLAEGDRVLFIASGTAAASNADSYGWLIAKGAGTLAATDFTFVVKLVGVADAVVATLGADNVTIPAGAGTANTDLFTIG